MDEIDVEIRKQFASEAYLHANIGDMSWQADLDEIMRLYDVRERNANDFWLTPEGSVERLIWAENNAPYIAALHIWDHVWKLVVGSRAEGKIVTYEAVSDYVKTKLLESQF